MAKLFKNMGPDDNVTQPGDLSTKQDVLAPGLGINISQNYSYKWNTSNFGVLYTRSIPADGTTVPTYTDVGCKSTRSDVDAIGGGGGGRYFPVKNGSTEGMGTATIVGQTNDQVISTSAALSITTTGISTPVTPDTNGVADLTSLFTSDNTSLMGVVRYANAAKSGSDMAATTAYAISTAYAVGDYILHDSTNYVCITAVTAAANTDWDTVAASFAARTAKTAQMADRTTNAVTVTNATMNITFPAAVTDKMRDFLVYIDATGYVAGGKFTVTLPTGADQYGDDFPAITETGEHLIAITEIAAGKFYVKAIELEEVTA